MTIVVFEKPPPDFVIPEGIPAEKELKELKEFCEKKENWWRQTDAVRDHKQFTRHVNIPCVAGHPNHVAHVVFTISVAMLAKPSGEVVQEELPIRHLTLGVDDLETNPDPAQLLTVAKYLGFTGGIADWQIGVHPGWMNNVVITQPMEPLQFKGRLEQRMQPNKNGVPKDEFWPKDLANDAKGQEQASRIVQATRLRRALEKAGLEQNAIKSLMDIWFNKPLKSHDAVPINELITVPLDLTEDEKVVFLELRKRVLGY